MKRLISLTLGMAGLLGLAAGGAGCSNKEKEARMQDQFVKVDGHDLIKPDGSKLYITGTNLGNWLNPEGYMFGFQRMNAPRQINDVICKLVGPDKAAEFWTKFKDNYITKADIDYIASTGANTIRLPFHYKLFTDEDYMGLSSSQDGFARVDSVVSWCKANNLYLILDMHDAPGGQTGDNIDDSYGYPWLMESEKSQQQFCDIWTRIADRYKCEPTILGYELLNEPVATYFEAVQDSLNARLVDVYKKGVEAIRKVDPDHIILIGAPQWNSNFRPLEGVDFGSQVMYTCHRYGGAPTPEAIRSYIDFRNKSGLPMYMGEIGHNSDEWQADFVKTMKENNIGYTFWPYKKRDGSCMVGITMPEEWEEILKFGEGAHATFAEIREAAPDRVKAQVALDKFIDSCRFDNCTPQVSYISSMGLNPHPDKQR
ncbi:glycoside hydrolase family 5 protein [uncultured Duncaniella sp.]|uniref:glycoside hydrolase family 5 protein n=1 Tax=uncultured Duncaniella sp. TaxID=2768039 RepID=UPI00265F7B2B|nr:glycoside hydrolase family 5 protein [uncultured Duncaniella sp.]